MGARIDAAEALVAQLTAAGVKAYIDPADVKGKNLPCVLVVPPRIDYTARSLVWGLKAISDRGATLAGWTALDDLIDQVAEVLPIETADPIGYQLLPNTEPLAAYDLRLTTTA